MTLITQITTIDPVYRMAQTAITRMRESFRVERDSNKLADDALAFEDTMNSLSGDILNLTPDCQATIHLACAELVETGNTANISIYLHESLLPTPVERVDVVTYQLAKKLYPLTTLVAIEPVQTTNVSLNTDSGTVDSNANTTATTTEEVEEIDSIFDELDAEIEDTSDETPLAFEQNDTMKILPSGMITLANTAASNVGGLQAGLTTFSHNPLATIIQDTQDLMLYYTNDNYANLNVALSGIYSDNTLNLEYKTLREAIGGPDGLSGAISQLTIFKDHTDRLSGLVLDDDSPNAEETGDSTDEFLNLNDFSGGPTVIFDFDASRFRSARYTIQATSAEADRGHQLNEIYILHDGYHAYTREVASVYSEDPFVTYTTRLLNGKIEVLANTASSNTDFVIHGTRLRIARVAESYADMSQMKIIQNHETLASYLDDGVDYVELQSRSLLHPEIVAELAREFRDMLVNLSDSTFLIQSTGYKQAAILAVANTILARRAAVQAAIDADHENFLSVRRLVEALNIAFGLTQAYTDETGNSIPSTTLNNEAIQAIEAEL